MKHLKKIGLLITMLFTSALTMAQNFNFKIEGVGEGIADGTWIYLRTASPEKKLDSAKVTNEKFVLKGKIDYPISQVAIYTAKYSNYMFFWLENKNISIKLKNGAFKEAIIKGSKTQSENELIAKLQEPIQKKEDSLYSLLNKTKEIKEKKSIQEEIKNVKNEAYSFYLNYAKKHPNSLILTSIIDIYASTWGKEKASNIFEKLSPEMKRTVYGQNINNFIQLNKPINIGEQFVDFEQADTNGKNIKLSQVRAKYTLLDFWASWCQPCRNENPNLVKIYNQFQNQGFTILGISADQSKEDWLKAIKDDQLLWKNVCDLKGDKNKAVLIYGVNAFPTNFLIDEKGIIIAKNLRGDALKEKLEELLKQ